MKHYVSPNKSLAYLLFELVVSLAVLMILMQLLVPVLANVRNQSLRKTQLLEQFELKAAVIDHFQSQLAPIFWQACGRGNGFVLEIGSSSIDLPDRINNKALLAQSDWLLASHIGRCNYPIEMLSLAPSIAYACDWSDDVIFSSCSMSDLGLVKEQDDMRTDFTFNNVALLGKTGFVLSKEPFIWYLAPGKVDNAFWRTPELSGNSLELWSGIKKMSFSPLLDTNNDGAFDTVTSAYGSYQVSQLKGLLLELLVTQDTCVQYKDEPEKEFVNQRGDIWRYSARCEFILSFVVSP